MPSADLLQRRMQLNRISRTLDFSDEAEMDGECERVKREEPLGTAERANEASHFRRSRRLRSLPPRGCVEPCTLEKRLLCGPIISSKSAKISRKIRTRR